MLSVITSDNDKDENVDKTYKPRQREASEESIGSLRLDDNGDEILTDGSPVKSNVLIFFSHCARASHKLKISQ
jgi:hypothetical protein